jgi:hypothetical protein
MFANGCRPVKNRLLLCKAVLCLVPLFLGTAHADDQYTVCIGDSNQCWDGSLWFSCGTSIQQAARAVCTTSNLAGQSVSQFTVAKMSDRTGGRCGYSTFRVTCKK